MRSVLAASLAFAGGGARPATVEPLPLKDGYCLTAAERKRVVRFRAGALEPDYPDDARRIVDASPAAQKTVELPQTGFHGTDILSDRAAAGVRAKLVAFVRG